MQPDIKITSGIIQVDATLMHLTVNGVVLSSEWVKIDGGIPLILNQMKKDLEVALLPPPTAQINSMIDAIEAIQVLIGQLSHYNKSGEKLIENFGNALVAAPLEDNDKRIVSEVLLSTLKKIAEG